MAVKGFQELLSEANAAVPEIAAEEAQALHAAGTAVFVDVRDQAEIQQGRIPGCAAAPRGFMEFIVTPDGPRHNPALAAEKKLVVYCGSGGRSLFAAKILKDLGYEDVVNLTGGLQGWAQSGGPIER